MKHKAVGILALVVASLGAGTSAYAQGGSASTVISPSPPALATPAGVTITAATSPLDLARAAFAAQGGEKLRAVKNMVLKGSVDLYPPNSTQSFPGAFVIVTAGDKLRIEIDARPAISFKQIFDG